jgi:GR25 family glycosyltransferase involved in LPS biosynthesis
MGGERQEAVERMFAQYGDDFDPPTFVPGVPSRSLRARTELFRIAYEVGLLPVAEWEALQEGFVNAEYLAHPDKFFECLKDVPITTDGRRGGPADLAVHYSVELWRKSKALNRGRGVLGCLLAHLAAMKKMVEHQEFENDEETFDLICEDNVRLCSDAARRIWETKEASASSSTVQDCHLQYHGWLGSLPNLEWVLNVHSKRTGLPSDAADKAFYYPITADFSDLKETSSVVLDGETITAEAVTSSSKTTSPATAHKTPGGTAIWGAYAYWISKQGYEALLNRLQKDVGSMLWKGKRMRCYIVKPIDKVLPRQVMDAYGREAIHVTRQPALFRAPMLTSKIHAQWDPEFCKSTAYQLSQTNLTWNELWLTEMERQIVSHFEATGDWNTIAQMKKAGEAEGDDL